MIIAIAVLPISFMAYQEFYVKPFLNSLPWYVRPFADPEPFPSTVYWDFTKLVWMGLGVSWLLIAVIKISKLKPRIKHSKKAVSRQS